jgi:conjugal transfer/entry exclusion protein
MEGESTGRQQLTSMALRRAEISQAWPSDRAQKRELAREYSRRLESTSSSTSKAEKLAR